MSRIIAKMQVLIGALLLQSQSYAASNLTDMSLNFSESDRSREKTFENCEKLLALEEKVNLTNREIETGYMIHAILRQISDSPLDYCGEFLAQVKKETVEKNPRVY